MHSFILCVHIIIVNTRNIWICKVASHSDRLDLMTDETLITFSSIQNKINFSICKVISVYLASNLVLDFIHLCIALDVLYVSYNCLKYACFFPFFKFIASPNSSSKANITFLSMIKPHTHTYMEIKVRFCWIVDISCLILRHSAINEFD